MKKFHFVHPISVDTSPNRELLGGKAAGLIELKRLGMRVPDGFIIDTRLCKRFYEMNGMIGKAAQAQITKQLRALEVRTGRTLGKGLLVSVRSGARVSMPGMMDTILNLGLMVDDDFGLGKLYDTIWPKYCMLFQQVTGQFPTITPEADLYNAINAVFKSWNNPRAIHYRHMHDIPDELGTAVVVQEMVFGNLNEKSATGVCFTRNPHNGKNELYGEFLMQAQGEDLVDGSHTPLPISQLEELMPQHFTALNQIAIELERHYKDMQDFEWTIQDDVLYMLQTRTGQRTGQAALTLAIEMMESGLISPKEAILRASRIGTPSTPQKRVQEAAKALCKGIGASGAVVAGQIALSWEVAVKMVQDGLRVILVKEETDPNDLKGMEVAAGILTFKGGKTSHAAVVARGMNKVAVVGCEAAIKLKFKDGDWLTLNGTTGEVFKGNVVAA